MLDLDLVKEHCRLEPDFCADDTLIGVYMGATKKHAERSTRRTLYTSASDPGYDDDDDRLLLDDDIRTAMLLSGIGMQSERPLQSWHQRQRCRWLSSRYCNPTGFMGYENITCRATSVLHQAFSSRHDPR